ncbi:MAG: DUF4328 domain-containing protein [Mycobacterium sp.]
MIQVCSACGTRWNVRDRQRVWCPRCRGTLLAPSSAAPPVDPRWGPGGAAPPTVGYRTSPRLPPGYRWIAVRPGAPPPTRSRRPPLGPTPRYAVMPRWGLVDAIAPDGVTQTSQAGHGPSVVRVRVTLFTGMVVLGIAALVHVVRYLLLIINRSTLLNPVVSAAGAWLGAVASMAAILAAISCAVMLTNWLVARRAAAFAHCGRGEPRPKWALWAGCLLPGSVAMAAAATFALGLVLGGGSPSWTRMAVAMAGCLLPLGALVWALVYVVELAKTEDQYPQLRTPIWVWWLSWLVSIVASVFATATSFARDAQGIANNTVAVIVACLLALTALLVSARVFDAFERKPIEKPAHRWVVVADDWRRTVAPARVVELEGEEPAA